MMHGQKALRFEAVPEDAVPENTKRLFLIEMFLADHTLLVGERKVRNSGFVDGGKFKERDLPGGERRTNNPDTGKPFEPEEFYVGALVKICCMPMRIIRADEWSLKDMELITVLRHCADPGTADIRFDTVCELIRHPP